MKRLLTITALTAALAAAPALAQLAQNSDAPIDIASDNFEGTNSACVTVWTGSAEALQDTARLRSDVMKTYFKVKTPGATGGQATCGDLIRLEATGSVYYATPQQRTRSDAAVYEVGSSTITMTGNVVVAQGPTNVMRGARAVINTETGVATMQGATKGRNSSGRVRGVFYPNQPATGQPR